jgi:outer membrane murein-binding lipoprotein Lpp
MTFPRFSARFAAVSLAAALLAGCVNVHALDQLADAKPEGSAFNKALFGDYRAVARSFGSVGASAGVAFDVGGSVELTEFNSSVGALAESYAEKALIAARGSVVEPESGVDVTTHKMRDRLIRAIERGRDNFPTDAARAQVDYDCWMMNAKVPQMKRASGRCLASLNVSLSKLETEAKPPAAPAPAPATSDNSDKPAIQP